MNQTVVNLLYLLSSVLFIYGLKGLSHPRTAVRGNVTGAVGMLIAILATLMLGGVRWEIIIAGMIVGSVIGAVWSFKVPMTAMPELVAMFNGFGGIASVLVAGAAFVMTEAADIDMQLTVSTAASGLIGGVTFTGSVVAFFKLQNVKWIPDGGFFRGQQVLSAVLLILCVLLGTVLVLSPASVWAYWLIVPVSFVLGVTLVSPIGGADMPVVIALLNSYSGLAACATGFVLMNSVLIVAGSLVGASGVILTNIMCKAMNRSVWNVVFGTLGPTGSTPSADDVYAGKVKATSPEEVAMLFDGARRVVIAPGYGMAAAQCQHVVRDLANLLEARGIDVEYAIHPVAGRMPGHMNVLLAEADIPYDKLKEMDEINPTFSQTDVAIVIGANDVVNPVARTDPNSPIAGMPILDVDKARTVVVIKRSLSPGFAGIPNPLFAADNTLMLFGDGKKAVLETIAAIKAG
ncbi:MAG TPA: NAD(P)(+) transhydrogenase (Re/Si-specific) subunit beta [bacterium]|nr:NAD(P)(+) transhydrogenase (Re/Si-specific) subunit beta [bacterium]HQQ00460.1 NAD(P)(+) transhydrogenase (Re/Si-specific) subunit beta [bacterium]